MGRVVLETDSQLDKSALESNKFTLAAMSGLVYELKTMVGSSFIDFSVK